MIQDLLSIPDYEPPMGDLFTNRRLDAGRAVWTGVLPGEEGVPQKRIIHQRVVRLHAPARLHRFGVRRGQGYHKCGSRQDLDWAVGVRVLAAQDGNWTEIYRNDCLRQPPKNATAWIQIPETVATGVIIELRKSFIDDGWTPWNLVMSCFVLEGELLEPVAPRRERLLVRGGMVVDKLPRGVGAWCRDGEVRYRTKDFEVGFMLSRPGFSYLGLHVESRENVGRNLLASRPVLFNQGPQLHPLGTAPLLAPAVRCDLEGVVTVSGNVVSYRFSAAGQTYELTWTILPTGLRLHVRRSADEPMLAWQSSAWTIGMRNSAAPSHVLGRLLQEGESGAVALPALLTFPAFGSWRISSSSSAGWGRSDCFRSHDLNLLELKVGEERTQEGLYLLPAGTHSAVFRLEPARPAPLLSESAPAVAKRALARTQWTALTFRSDTATLSNNGASMHCPICMDTWSSVALPIGNVLPGLHASEFLRHSIERWLTGGPGYAAGRLLQDGKSHDADDEYLMTGASALRGLGDYLRFAATPAWFQEFRPYIQRRIGAARARDLDGDGLIESVYRTGVSGTKQWSTCWFDVISFGWKDAFANAILYGALRELAAGLSRLGERDEPARLEAWMARIRENYVATFWNPQTQWLAGWRCRDDKLHDHAFLPVNGAAVAEGLVEQDQARGLLLRLLAEMKRVGMPDAALGMPGNLHLIPDEDLSDIIQGYPLGYYQNGGRTHAQTRHFIMALYRTGLTAQADRLLKRLCAGFAEARVFGGNQSGVDWRYWDDRPCGYEGLLTDQFGVLEPVLWRWGKRRRPKQGRS